MKKNIDSFMLEDWKPTAVEEALMNGCLDNMLNEILDSKNEEIPIDFLEIQDFDTAMGEIKSEIDKWH